MELFKGRFWALLTVLFILVGFQGCGSEGNGNSGGDLSNQVDLHWTQPLETSTRDFAVVSGRFDDSSLVDVDGDGDGDLVPNYVEGGRLVWYDNKPLEDNLFIPREFQAPEPGANKHVIHVSDLDNDGDFDFLVVRLSGLVDWLSWYENDGQTSPNFTRHKVQHPARAEQIVANPQSRLVFDDFNSDGRIDIVLSSPKSDSIQLFVNKIPSLDSFSVVTIVSDVDVTSLIGSADLEGDGDKDLLFFKDTKLGLAWLKNNGNTTFEQSTVYSGDKLRGIHSIDAVDLDQDGDSDIVLRNGVSDVLYFENQFPSVNYSIKKLSQTNSAASPIRLADFDKDGDIDLAWFEDTKLFIHENLGGETLELAPHLIWTSENDGQFFRTLNTADIDDDSDIDLYFSEYIVDGGPGRYLTTWVENSGSNIDHFQASGPTETSTGVFINNGEPHFAQLSSITSNKFFSITGVQARPRKQFVIESSWHEFDHPAHTEIEHSIEYSLHNSSE